jgi:hypothetical protein
MRGLWLVAGLVGGMTACTAPGGASRDEGRPASDGNYDDWADEAPVQYFARLGGSIDMGVDDPETEGTDEGDEGSGEEYATVTSSVDGIELKVECDWRWKTDTFDSPYLDDCVGCDVGWDVTCYDGHETAGNCAGWIDPDTSVGPVQFYLAFEPDGIVEGTVEHGMIYVRHSLYDEWKPYAEATREGTLVRYEYSYQLF